MAGGMRRAWSHLDTPRTIFLFRALAWAGCVAFSWNSPWVPVLAGIGLLVVGGGWALSGRVGWPHVNAGTLVPELAVVTVAIRLTGGLHSPLFALYGGLAIVLTSLGNIAWSFAALPVLVLLYGWATGFLWTDAGYWFRVFLLMLFIVAAGTLGEAFRRREQRAREAEGRLDQLEALRTIHDGLLREEPLEVLLETLLEQTVALLKADAGFVGVTEEGGQVRIKAAVGLPERVRLGAWPPATARRVAEAYASRMRVLIASDTGERLDLPGSDDRLFKSLAILPLVEGEDVIGVLGLGAVRAAAFADVDPALLEAVAGLVHNQIRYDRERAASRKRGRLLTTLERVGKLVNSNLRMENLLPVLHQTVAEELQSDGFFVLLTVPGDPMRGYMAYLYDEGRRYEPTTVVLSENSPTVQVLKTGTPRLWIGQPSGAQTIGSSRPVVGAMIAPLIWESQVIGAVSVQSYQHPYDQDQLDFLTAVANQAAIAVHNAQLYERAEEVALTDHMTGLGNARRLAQVGDELIRRAVAEGRPLSVMLIDSDSLKAVNDQWGHRAGDAHLQHLAATILDNIRAGDHAFRYAGDEFVVVLPDTSLSMAERVAERIRSAIAGGFTWQDQRLDNISVSIGVTELRPTDRHDVTMEELFRRADAAMYQAKLAGKNRVALGS